LNRGARRFFYVRKALCLKWNSAGIGALAVNVVAKSACLRKNGADVVAIVNVSLMDYDISADDMTIFVHGKGLLSLRNAGFLLRSQTFSGPPEMFIRRIWVYDSEIPELQRGKKGDVWSQIPCNPMINHVSISVYGYRKLWGRQVS
ncbi:MAG TPA: hypothetical protein VHO70_15120, partial [Chitinispirillaceae bacterium]|nr:hypothetical protein [Chitinispirillaceae bacterium]